MTGKTIFVRGFLFQRPVMTNPSIFWTLLCSNAYEFFSKLDRKSKAIVDKRICLFLLLIFAQQGLFEIQLTVYSALSCLTDFGIYYITRCGIWFKNISYSIYPTLTRTEKGYITKIIPFFFCSIIVYKCTYARKCLQSEQFDVAVG